MAKRAGRSNILAKHEGFLSLDPSDRGMAATVAVEPGAIVFAFDDGEQHHHPLEIGMFTPHDTMTMRFVFDGVEMYWRDGDPLVFAELCQRAAVSAPARRAGRRSASSESAVPSRFKLPYLRSSPAVESSPVVAAPQAKTAKTGKRRRRSEHEHSWVASHVPGGIVRRVCETCRQVSIDLTELPDPPDHAQAEAASVPGSGDEPWPGE